MKPAQCIVPVAVAAICSAAVFSAFGAALGSGVAAHRYSAERQAMIRENYTDRARICLEAAALLRNHETDQAITYLEARTLAAIRGVPMGRPYSDLPEKSQALLVGAERYQGAFPGVDFEVRKLTHGVPGDHGGLSENIKKLGRQE